MATNKIHWSKRKREVNEVLLAVLIVLATAGLVSLTRSAFAGSSWYAEETIEKQQQEYLNNKAQ